MGTSGVRKAALAARWAAGSATATGVGAEVGGSVNDSTGVGAAVGGSVSDSTGVGAAVGGQRQR